MAVVTMAVVVAAPVPQSKSPRNMDLRATLRARAIVAVRDLMSTSAKQAQQNVVIAQETSNVVVDTPASCGKSASVRVIESAQISTSNALGGIHRASRVAIAEKLTAVAADLLQQRSPGATLQPDLATRLEHTVDGTLNAFVQQEVVCHAVLQT